MAFMEYHVFQQNCILLFQWKKIYLGFCCFYRDVYSEPGIALHEIDTAKSYIITMNTEKKSVQIKNNVNTLRNKIHGSI